MEIMSRKPLTVPVLPPAHAKAKHLSKDQRQQALSWLALKFPEALDNRLRIRPLKIGILQDILTHADEAASAGISKTKLREALVLFTRRIDYLTCLKAREIRVDLQGHPTAPVTPEEAEKAALKIKKRVEKASFHAAPAKQPPARPAYMTRPPAYAAASAPPAKSAPMPSITIKLKFTKPLDATLTLKLKERLDLVE